MGALRDQIYRSCAQLVGHSIRLRRDLLVLPEVDGTRQRAALDDAERALGEIKKNGLGSRPGKTEPEIPPRLFDPIEGYDGPKKLLRAALHSERPVHVLLVGPPGTGKTQLLQRIASLPNSRYATGPTISSSGMFTYLLDHPACKRLVIDELDKAERTDRYLLLTLMESGRITRLQHRAIEEESRTVWVFAAANDDRDLEEPLRRRFVRLEFTPYTREQAAAISERVLRREGVAPARARAIAQAAAERSNDPRIAVQVARLAPDGQEIGPVLEQVTASKL